MPAVPMQWCWPPTRQHTGTEAVAPCASGASNAARMITKMVRETPRRIVMPSLAQRRKSLSFAATGFICII